MTDQQIFEHYINVAKMIGHMFPQFLEVIVHNLTTPEKSICYIHNGHITNRKIGDSTTSLGYERIKGNVPDTMINYTNESPRGEKLKSSSIAIRNEKGDLIGAFSLNLNVSVFDSHIKLLESLIGTINHPIMDSPEKFHPKSVQDDISEIINNIIVAKSWQGSNLSWKEKAQIVRELFENGHFNKRSAASAVAKVLKISKPTVYKYMKL